MKFVLCLFLMVGYPVCFFGQSNDTTAIRETVMNYIEGFYTGNYQRVEKAVHPELAKRIIETDGSGNIRLRNMGSSELVFNAKKFKKPIDNSGLPFMAEIKIYDISNGIALVKVSQNKMKFFDYLHMGKLDGTWKIINVLWTGTEK